MNRFEFTAGVGYARLQRITVFSVPAEWIICSNTSSVSTATGYCVPRYQCKYLYANTFCYVYLYYMLINYYLDIMYIGIIILLID